MCCTCHGLPLEHWQCEACAGLRCTARAAGAGYGSWQRKPSEVAEPGSDAHRFCSDRKQCAFYCEAFCTLFSCANVVSAGVCQVGTCGTRNQVLGLRVMQHMITMKARCGSACMMWTRHPHQVAHDVGELDCADTRQAHLCN
jgi:hypothetical protein